MLERVRAWWRGRPTSDEVLAREGVRGKAWGSIAENPPRPDGRGYGSATAETLLRTKPVVRPLYRDRATGAPVYAPEDVRVLVAGVEVGGPGPMAVQPCSSPSSSSCDSPSDSGGGSCGGGGGGGE